MWPTGILTRITNSLTDKLYHKLNNRMESAAPVITFAHKKGALVDACALSTLPDLPSPPSLVLTPKHHELGLGLFKPGWVIR